MPQSPDFAGFAALADLVVFALLAGFLAVVVRRFGAGAAARRSASNSMARCGVMDSTEIGRAHV